MEWMKITVEAYGNRYTVEISDECDVHECLDAMLKLMELISYQKKSIENAIVNKYHELPNKD